MAKEEAQDQVNELWEGSGHTLDSNSVDLMPCSLSARSLLDTLPNNQKATDQYSSQLSSPAQKQGLLHQVVALKRHKPDNNARKNGVETHIRSKISRSDLIMVRRDPRHPRPGPMKNERSSASFLKQTRTHDFPLRSIQYSLHRT